MAAPPNSPKDKSLLRNLGEFFGHIAHGIKTDPAKPRTVTKKTIEHESRDTPQGKVVLRRTIIEEVELPPPAPPKVP
jgi:hypothetical protein